MSFQDSFHPCWFAYVIRILQTLGSLNFVIFFNSILKPLKRQNIEKLSYKMHVNENVKSIDCHYFLRLPKNSTSHLFLLSFKIFAGHGANPFIHASTLSFLRISKKNRFTK